MDYNVYFQAFYSDVTVNNMLVLTSRLNLGRINKIYIMYFGTDSQNI